MKKQIENQSANLSAGEEFVKSWTENAAHLQANGLYDPAEEKDSCGVGLVAAIDGKPSRSVVAAGIDALKAVWHRGAVDADGKTCRKQILRRKKPVGQLSRARYLLLDIISMAGARYRSMRASSGKKLTPPAPKSSRL